MTPQRLLRWSGPTSGPAASKERVGAERSPLFSLLKKSCVTDYQFLKRVTPDRRLLSIGVWCRIIIQPFVHSKNPSPFVHYTHEKTNVKSCARSSRRV